MRTWIGALMTAWYLLLPYRGDVKPIASQTDSLLSWQRLGTYQSALGCELARQKAEAQRAVATAVCIFSDDPRLGRQLEERRAAPDADDPGALPMRDDRDQ